METTAPGDGRTGDLPTVLPVGLISHNYTPESSHRTEGEAGAPNARSCFHGVGRTGAETPAPRCRASWVDRVKVPVLVLWLLPHPSGAPSDETVGGRAAPRLA